MKESIVEELIETIKTDKSGILYNAGVAVESKHILTITITFEQLAADRFIPVIALATDTNEFLWIIRLNIALEAELTDSQSSYVCCEILKRIKDL